MKMDLGGWTSDENPQKTNKQKKSVTRTINPTLRPTVEKERKTPLKTLPLYLTGREARWEEKKQEFQVGQKKAYN